MRVGEPGYGGENSVKSLLCGRSLAAGGLYFFGPAVWQNSAGTPCGGLLCTSLYISGILTCRQGPWCIFQAGISYPKMAPLVWAYCFLG